jgi:hypothetical protein
MKLNTPILTLALLILLQPTGLAYGQMPSETPSVGEGDIALTEDRQVQQNLLETPPAAVENAIVPTHDPCSQPGHCLRQVKLDTTYLPGSGNDGLAITDLESSGTFAIPCADGWAPLLVAPDFATHFWRSHMPPSPHPDAQLPTTLYDASLDFSWRPRPAQWLFLELGITPGFYGDYHASAGDSFQMRGRGLAVVAFSPQWQVVAGLLYINRNQTKVLPAGGVVWSPNEDTKFRLVFPEPRISRHLGAAGKVQWWAYLGGEFGGGRWAVEQNDGRVESIDYTDIRVILGLECVAPCGVKGHVEAGYVFGRKVNFSSAAPDFDPADTMMVRVGISY